jgi:hypothetical protein
VLQFATHGPPWNRNPYFSFMEIKGFGIAVCYAEQFAGYWRRGIEEN